jgi:hypothetical protein
MAVGNRDKRDLPIPHTAEELRPGLRAMLEELRGSVRVGFVNSIFLANGRFG